MDQSSKKRVFVSGEAVDSPVSLPLFWQDATQRAAEEGKIPKQILDEDRQAILARSSAANRCVEPEDVDLVTSGEPVSQDVLDHLDSCGACQELVELAAPSPEGFRRLRNEIRRLAVSLVSQDDV